MEAHSWLFGGRGIPFWHGVLECFGKLLDIDVSLGIGDNDTVFLELVPDGQHNCTANVSDTVGGIVDPETELEVYGVVPEAGNEAARFRVLQGSAYLLGGL